MNNVGGERFTHYGVDRTGKESFDALLVGQSIIRLATAIREVAASGRDIAHAGLAIADAIKAHKNPDTSHPKQD